MISRHRSGSKLNHNVHLKVYEQGKSISSLKLLFTNELPHEKTNNLRMRKQRRRSASRYYREADQRLCFRYMDSTIPLLSKPKISSLSLSSVTVLPGLCGTWSETTLLVFPRGGSNKKCGVNTVLQ